MVVLEDLTRSELLRLVRDRLAIALACHVTEADLIWAQWESSCDRMKDLAQACTVADRERHSAWDAVYMRPAKDRATEILRLQILQKAETAQKLADRNYKACQTRCDRLHRQYEAAIKNRRSSHV